jgi:tetratricopeptide (TPR) repeat protein
MKEERMNSAVALSHRFEACQRRRSLAWSGVTLLFFAGCASADVKQFREGVDLSAKGQTHEAAEAYMGALETNPGLVEARLNLGALLYKEGRYNQAEREFRLVLAQDPEHLVARENLATTLEARGGYDEDAYQQWRLALVNENRPEWKDRGKQSVKRLENKLRAAADHEVGGPLSDVDTTLPKFAAIPRPNDVALVIGIEKYQKLIPARHARADAERVAAYLRALGYAPRNVEVLLNEQATQTALRVALEQWLPEHARADSRVLVYYSGHGSVNPATGETYLMPHDGDVTYLAHSAYPVKMLYSKLSELKAKQIVVTLDSCFSGQGGRSVMMEGARPAIAKLDDPTLSSRHMAVLAASDGTQISTSSKEKRHGVFTYYFLKALQDGNQDLASIYEYVNFKVQDEAKLQNVTQAPSVRPGPDQVRQFVLWDKQ